MIPSNKFYPLTIMLMISALVISSISLIASLDYSSIVIAVIGGITANLIYVITFVLCISFVIKLTSTISDLKYEPKCREIELTSHDIKKLHQACIKLDKYGVQYKIDLEEVMIHAYVSMGMYTRMSVADNLDYAVAYHITGTDKILVKK